MNDETEPTIQEIPVQTDPVAVEDSPKVEEPYGPDELIHFVKVNVKGPKGSKTIVKHLWDRNLRVNFYVKTVDDRCVVAKNHIAESKFVVLGVDDDGKLFVKETI